MTTTVAQVGKNELYFELINAASSRKNELYTQESHLDSDGNKAELKVHFNETVELYSEAGGNASKENYTLALVFQNKVLKGESLGLIQVEGDPTMDWSCTAVPEGNESVIYLLAKTNNSIKKGEGEVLRIYLQHLAVNNLPASASNLELRYNKRLISNQFGPEYIQTHLDLISHSGIKNSPFKLALVTPTLLVKSEAQELILNLRNVSSESLNISKLHLQLSFDLSESNENKKSAAAELNSSTALMSALDFQKESFKVDIKRSNKSIGAFKKNVDSNAIGFLGVLESNPDGQENQGFKTLAAGKQIAIRFIGVQPLLFAGISQLKLNYYNVKGYWDGGFEISIGRTLFPIGSVTSRKIKDHEVVDFKGQFNFTDGIKSSSTLRIDNKNERDYSSGAVIYSKADKETLLVENKKDDSSSALIANAAKFINHSNAPTVFIENENNKKGNQLAAAAKIQNESLETPTIEVTNFNEQGLSAQFNNTINVKGKVQENGNDLLPKGVIVMWSGKSGAIPKGWLLCDGENNTPDLRGRFIVGQGKSSDGKTTYSLDSKGGNEEITLSENQMPEHKHEVKRANGSNEFLRFARAGSNRAGDKFNVLYNWTKKLTEYFEGEKNDSPIWAEFISDPVGGSKPHENRPPYYALAYIMKQ